jgi:hypothetical protein
MQQDIVLRLGADAIARRESEQRQTTDRKSVV